MEGGTYVTFVGSAKIFFRLFTLDRLLALVAIAAGVIAIYYETEVHSSVHEIISSLTTKYVSRFPANLDDAKNVITGAQNDDELLILNDVVGYGYYSCPPKYKDYLEAIRHASEKARLIRILIYDDKGANDVLTTQISQKNYEELSSSNQLKNTTESVCQPGDLDLKVRQQRFWYFFGFYHLPPPSSYADFQHVLSQQQNHFCKQLTASDHVEVRAIKHQTGTPSNGPSIAEPTFFWMRKDKEVVFAYPNTGQVGKGATFKSSDYRLLEIFLAQFDQAWQKATPIEGDCYSNGTPEPNTQK